MTDRTIATLRLQDGHGVPTWTRHRIAGEAMPRPHHLRIVGAEDGFFLYYCGPDGQAMTDTFHLTLGDAFAQAEFEFGVQRHEWTEA